MGSIILKNTHLYHASKDDDLILSKGRGIWVTTDKTYANLVKSQDNRYYTYNLCSKKQLNLFDARDPEVLEEVKLYVKDNDIEYMAGFVSKNPESLKDVGVYDWDSYFDLISEFADWELTESPFMVDAADALGYDGYVSVEAECENYFIFDSSNLQVFKLEEAEK